MPKTATVGLDMAVTAATAYMLEGTVTDRPRKVSTRLYTRQPAKADAHATPSGTKTRPTCRYASLVSSSGLAGTLLLRGNVCWQAKTVKESAG